VSKPSPKLSILARLAHLSVYLKIRFNYVIIVSLVNSKFAFILLTARRWLHYFQQVKDITLMSLFVLLTDCVFKDKILE
jgi:hypothetical protein